MIILYPGWRKALKDQWKVYRIEKENIAITGNAATRIKALEKLIVKGEAREQTRTEASDRRRKPVKT